MVVPLNVDLVDGAVFTGSLVVRGHKDAVVGAIARDVDESERKPGGVGRGVLWLRGEIESLASPHYRTLSHSAKQGTRDSTSAMVWVSHDILDVDVFGFVLAAESDRTSTMISIAGCGVA